MQQGHSIMFWSILDSGVFSKQLSMEMAEYEDEMLIWDQNHVFCGASAVNFSVWFLKPRSWIF